MRSSQTSRHLSHARQKLDLEVKKGAAEQSLVRIFSKHLCPSQITMPLSTAFVSLILLVASSISDVTGLSPFSPRLDETTAAAAHSNNNERLEHLEDAFRARRMAPTEADQKCIDDTKAMFYYDNSTTWTELTMAQSEAVAQCDGYYSEVSLRNVTSIDEETGSETTIEAFENIHVEGNLVGCDVLSLWEEQCIDAGGFVARVPDLDLTCLVTSDDAPPNVAGASATASLRSLDDCFAASCEGTVKKLQSGTFDGLVGLPMLAGPLDPISECEVTLVGDQASAGTNDGGDDTTSGAISTIANLNHVGGIVLLFVASVVM